MKKFQLILICTLLLGMILTVVQYLPILEEEVPEHLTELVKKGKESTGSDDDCEDDTVDDKDGKAELFISQSDPYTRIGTPQDKFYLKVPLYQSLIRSISTPPPEL